MPNTPARAAAKGLPKITRRKALALAGSAGAAAAATAIATAIPSPAMAAEDCPEIRVQQMARELSDALNDFSGGRYMAEIFPSRNPARPYRIAFAEMEVHYPRWHVRAELVEVIEAHAKAFAALDSASPGIDRIPLGHEPTKAAWRRWKGACRAEKRALIALCKLTARNPAEADAKARYLLRLASVGLIEADHNMTALLRSMVWNWHPVKVG